MNFAVVVANFMAEHYEFKNCLYLAMITVTYDDMVWSGDAGRLLASHKPIRKRCSALMDFKHFILAKTGLNIGYWLDDTHRFQLAAKPDYLGTHIVDGAANAGKSVRCLEWNTKGDCSRKGPPTD